MRIFVLDDDHDLRETLAELIETATDGTCLALASFSEMVQRNEEVLKADLAIIDINLGANQPTGLESERWLKENHFSGRTVFLTGHGKSHPLVRQAIERGTSDILEKPVAIEAILSLVPQKRSA